MKMKYALYAYPSSPMAKKLGWEKSGCWAICSGDPRKIEPDKIHFTNSNKEAASREFEWLPFEEAPASYCQFAMERKTGVKSA